MFCCEQYQQQQISWSWIDHTMARNVINLEEVVREWAWREYKSTATSSQKKLIRKDTREPRKYLRLEVDWSEATFRDETRWSPLSVDQSDSASNVTPNNISHGSIQFIRINSIWRDWLQAHILIFRLTCLIFDLIIWLVIDTSLLKRWRHILGSSHQFENLTAQVLIVCMWISPNLTARLK